MTTSRLSGIDEAKGLAIFLVVVGHVWLGLFAAGICEETVSFVWIIGWIYSFHMPVFFVIAGMLATRSLSKRGGQGFLVSKVRTIIYPYLLWSILQWLLQRAFQTSGNAETSNSLLSLLVFPIGQFWFLYTLAVTYLLHSLTHRFGFPNWGFVTLALAFYLFARADFWPWEILQGVAGYSIFYAVGTWVSTDTLRPGRNQVWLGVAGLAFVALSVTFGWQKPLIGKLFVAIMGCGGLMTLALWISQKPWAMVFRELGKASLAIFVAHTIFAAGLRTILLKLGFWQPEWHLVLGVLAGLLGPFLLVILEQRMGIRYFFTWPANAGLRST